MKIEEGAIVTVVAEDSEMNTQQGAVVEIDPSNKDGAVAVQFPKGAFMYYVDSGDDLTRRFDAWQLQPAAHYAVGNVGRYFFPFYYHSTFELPYPFSTENSCMHDGCADVCTCRVVVNFYGSLCEYDVCDVHAGWHLRMTEMEFPLKPGYWPKTVPEEFA